MTANSLKDFQFDGDPRDSEYWSTIISVRRQGYDPDDDGMISVPAKELEELQQCYVIAQNALHRVAGTKTQSDIARECLKELNN